MQRKKTLRLAGVSLSAAALGLLTAEGTAAAHEGTSSPDLRGRVASVGSGDFVLKKFDGTTETVDTTGATTYSEPGSSVAPAGVLDAENVAVTLDLTAPSPTATNVIVVPERVGGRVTEVSGSTLTVTNRRGTATVVVTPQTKYLEKSANPTGVSDGDLITVLGLPDPSTAGDVDAQTVAIFAPPQQPRPVPPPVTPQPQPQSQPQQQPVTGSQPQWMAQPAAPATQSPHAGPPPAQPADPRSGGVPGTPAPAPWGRSNPGAGIPSPHGSAGGGGYPKSGQGTAGEGFGGR